MNEQQFDQLSQSINDIKDGIQGLQMADVRIEGSLAMIEKRLFLIEQRLSRLEPFIPVDNKHLEYHH